MFVAFAAVMLCVNDVKSRDRPTGKWSTEGKAWCGTAKFSAV